MLMVPLKDVEVKATLEGSYAMVYFDIIYVNPGKVPIECTYEFELEDQNFLSKLVISKGDKVILAEVMKKKKA